MYVNEMKSMLKNWDEGISLFIPKFTDGDDAEAQHQWLTAWIMEHIRLYVSERPEFQFLSPEEFRRYQSAAYDALIQKHGAIIQYLDQKEFDLVETLVGNLSKKLYNHGSLPAAVLVEVTNPMFKKDIAP